MKLKALLFSAVAIFSLGVLADAANVLVTYSSKPVDHYADGRPVADGEWYALVWTPKLEGGDQEARKFGGLKSDCTPMVEGDEIVMKAPLAKDGHCPCAVFQVDSDDFEAKGYASGWFAVILLDTRDEAGKPATNANEMVVHNAAISTSDTIEVTVGTPVDRQEVASIGEGYWDIPMPVIIGINPSVVETDTGREYVDLTVSNVIKRCAYKVWMGESLDKMETFELKEFDDINADTTVPYHVEKKNSGFFRISIGSKSETK